MIKRVLKYFIPKSLKKPVFSSKKVWSIQKKDDQEQDIIRVHQSIIKSDDNPKGVFYSGELVVIKNPDNGRFTMVYVKGPGPLYVNMFKVTIAMRLKTRKELGLERDQQNAALKLYRAKTLGQYYGKCYVLGSGESRTEAQNSLKMSFFNQIFGVILGAVLGSLVTVVAG